MVGTSEQPGIYFAVVGRKSLQDDLNIRRLEKLKMIELSRIKNQDDIDRYIQKRLRDMDVLHEMRKRKPDGLKQANSVGARIMKKVSEGSDGVFLWARLLLDELMKKDLPQITSILANPPSTLDEMIHSVFERLDRDDELEHPALKTILLFMAYARRPLLFGELNAAVTIPDGRPRYLLWRHTRGKLSSAFDLQFYRNRDPELESVQVEEPQDSIAENSGSERSANSDCDDGSLFDFTSDVDSVPDSILMNGDDILSPTVEASRRHDFDLPDCSEDAFSHFSNDQLRTTVTFCHARIRDYLVQESMSQTRKHPFLSIVPALKNPHAAITILCLNMLHFGSSQDEYREFLCDVGEADYRNPISATRFVIYMYALLFWRFEPLTLPALSTQFVISRSICRGQTETSSTRPTSSRSWIDFTGFLGLRMGQCVLSSRFASRMTSIALTKPSGACGFRPTNTSSLCKSGLTKPRRLRVLCHGATERSHG